MINRVTYINRIEPFIDKPIIKVITGIRRCGKSTFLKMVQNKLLRDGVNKKNILFISKDSFEFDSIMNYKQLAEYSNNYFGKKQGKKYLFIDEIQEIQEWERALSFFLTDSLADLYITGSNSRLLSSDIATYISGRYIEIKMQPLSFSEFLDFRGVTEKNDFEREFDFYIRYGGFPGIHQMEFNEEVIHQYLDSIISTIVLKDVVSKNNIRDYTLLERILKFTADNCGNITSSKSIANYLKAQHIKSSVDTVQSYLNMLCSAFIFYKVPRFDIKGKMHLEFYEKYFLNDVGLKHSLLGFRIGDIAGHLENIVYLELLYRGYQVSIGKYQNIEIDFVATKMNEVIYIQVAYLLTEKSTIEREFGALEKINDNYPKIVVSLDKYFDSNQAGIKWINLITFLTTQW